MRFEIYSMNLTRDGFKLTFTKTLDREPAENVDNYSLRHFELDWHAAYGTSPSKSANVKPTSAKLSDDGKTVTLVLPELLAKKIYELHVSGVTATDASKLEHPQAFYTLNRLK